MIYLEATGNLDNLLILSLLLTLRLVYGPIFVSIRWCVRSGNDCDCKLNFCRPTNKQLELGRNFVQHKRPSKHIQSNWGTFAFVLNTSLSCIDADKSTHFVNFNANALIDNNNGQYYINNKCESENQFKWNDKQNIDLLFGPTQRIWFAGSVVANTKCVFLSSRWNKNEIFEFSFKSSKLKFYTKIWAECYFNFGKKTENWLRWETQHTYLNLIIKYANFLKKNRNCIKNCQKSAFFFSFVIFFSDYWGRNESIWNLNHCSKSNSLIFTYMLGDRFKSRDILMLIVWQTSVQKSITLER